LTEMDVVLTAAKAMNDKRGTDIVALNVSEMTSVTDYMLICSARNSILVRAIADEVEEKLSEIHSLSHTRTDGYRDGRWIVLDYGTILVHIFHEQEREFYRLERLWETAENRVPLELEEN
jgi:ribosome-associated protein